MRADRLSGRRKPDHRGEPVGATPAGAEPEGVSPEGSAAALPVSPRLRLIGEDTYPNWEAIYRDNVNRIYRLMYAKVGNRPDAEDLTTEVFLAALRPLQISASVGEVRSYLLATARTVLVGHWRRTLGRQITTLDEEHLQPTSAFSQTDTDTLERVERILAALPERYRRILQLRFLGSCSLREAAAELGVTLANAKVLQHRALRRAAVIAEGMLPEGTHSEKRQP